jgi:flagellar FliL protein
VAKEAGKKDGKGGGGLIGLIVVTLVALGFGAGFGFFLDGQLKSARSKPADQEDEAKTDVPVRSSVPASGKIVAMAPIVANLAQPEDVWIRIEASLLIDGMMQGADVLASQLSQDIVAYLRTATLSQFEGPSGFQNLREDLMDRATIRDRTHIKDVIIHGVVVE